MIVNAAVCSNCKKLVPEKCDGRTFKLPQEGWARAVCRGRDGDDVDVANMRYLVTVGHGNRHWTPMEEEHE